MNFNLVAAMMIRYFYGWRHNLDRLTDSFYWPAIDIFIWGLTSVFVREASFGIPNIILIVLSGVVFWTVVWRAQYEISINLLTEIWDKNLVNIFVSPLRIQEWILSVMGIGLLKMLLTLIVSAVLAFLMYSFNIFIYGMWLLPFIASLLLTGWALGFLVAAIIVRYGQNLQTFAWAGPVIIAPFSAFYYPVSTLPDWAQKVSYFVPSSYVMEGMREIISTGSFSVEKLAISFLLNIIYLSITVTFFIVMFRKSRKLGLGRLVS